MSGEFVIKKKLTAAVVARLAKLNMSLEILVDCSHARNVETMRPDRPERAVITKPIELDTTLRAASGFNPDDALKALKEKRDADTRSVEAHLWEACTKGRAEGEPSRIHELNTRALKIEFPNFDTSIVNLKMATGDFGEAVKACTAEDAAAFDGLPVRTRRCMGMYRRESQTRFVNDKGREPLPRTAVADG